MESGTIVGSGGLKAIMGILGAVVAVVASFLGMPLVGALAVLMGLMLLDTVTALVAKRGDWDPEVGWSGWRRKVNEILLVLSIALLQGGVELGVQLDLERFPTAAAIAGVYAVLELMSIVRNAKAAGVKWIPDGLANLLRSEVGGAPDNPVSHLRGRTG